MADANKTLLTRADITSAANAPTGRKTFTIDGNTYEIGFTGIRDLSGSRNTTFTSGRILLLRDGSWVILHLVDLIAASDAGAYPVAMNNNRPNIGGFVPPYPATGRAAQRTSTGTGPSTDPDFGADIYVNTGLGIVLAGVVPGVPYNGTAMWRTNGAWPTSLPGVADGDPIGV